MMCCVSTWAEYVNYIDDKGIKQGCYATVVTNSTSTLNAGWYVVTGADVQTGSLTCKGAVHLILADGAKLTATGNSEHAGITVSDVGNSLTIYGQDNQNGQLIAKGGDWAAGIGGGNTGSGSNITINGGVVTATGGILGAGIGGGGYGGSGSNITINDGTVTANSRQDGAGIGGGDGGSGSNITINGGVVTATCEYFGAGIGGGQNGSGSNITINGGTVTANGGQAGAGIGGGQNGSGNSITINGGTVTATGGLYAAGIGGGDKGSSSNIKVSADCHVFADGENPPTTEIEHDSNTDLASALDKRYAIIKIDQAILSALRSEAIATINKAIEGVANEYILDIAQEAENKIRNTEGRMAIKSIKDAALAKLEEPVKFYNSGKAKGKAEAFGDLGTKQTGTAVKVTKDDKEIILYAPDKVEYIITK